MSVVLLVTLFILTEISPYQLQNYLILLYKSKFYNQICLQLSNLKPQILALKKIILSILNSLYSDPIPCRASSTSFLTRIFFFRFFFFSACLLPGHLNKSKAFFTLHIQSKLKTSFLRVSRGNKSCCAKAIVGALLVKHNRVEIAKRREKMGLQLIKAEFGFQARHDELHENH
jgi:hypothetical protein